MFLSLPGRRNRAAFVLVYQDGSRYSGELQKVEKGALVLKVPGVAEPLRLPTAGLRSLVDLDAGRSEAPVKDESTGRLETPGVRLVGKLVDASEKPGASCLAWQPLSSETASPLTPGVSGHIIYKEPPPLPQPQQVLAAATDAMHDLSGGRFNCCSERRPKGAGAMALRFMNALAEPTAAAGSTGKPAKSGDRFTSATATSFPRSSPRSTRTASGSVPVFRQHVRAERQGQGGRACARAAQQHTAGAAHRTKRDRLLTLPRMQKADPPTHLIRSKNGDYLRGRVTRMDDKTLKVEVRLETRTSRATGSRGSSGCMPTSSTRSKKPTAAELDDAGAGPAKRRRPPDVPRRAVRREPLSGKSDVLGPCQVAVKQIDQLLIGDAIEKAAAQLAYQQWKLKNAPEPKYVTAGDGGDGRRQRGRVAAGRQAGPRLRPRRWSAARRSTWPTARARWSCSTSGRPGAARASRRCRRSSGRPAQFKDQGVQLVAVNLQETAEQVTAMLERQKLKVTVALDRDGAVADKYKAVAIPQTVIIGRDGKSPGCSSAAGRTWKTSSRRRSRRCWAARSRRSRRNRRGESSI